MGQPIVQYESGQTSYPMEALTDSGDRTTFEASASPFSGVAGFTPSVLPNGILTGGVVTPATSGADDDVDVAALTCNLNGVETSVSADTDVAITRPATNVAKVCSVTINSSGSVAVVAGSDGSDTSFSETRGADGGPPFIPTDSIEIAQVRVTSSTAAAIAASEIKQVVGLHRESASYPIYSINYAEGKVVFADALPAIHTGSVGKAVHASFATPLFAAIPKSSNWTPAESTYSINSTDTYDGPIGSSQASLNQASFDVVLDDGIRDNFMAAKDKNIWVEFRPDRDVSVPKQLTQGILGVSRNYPAGGGNPTASCTLTPSVATTDIAS
jgi:hypothetical protein